MCMCVRESERLKPVFRYPRGHSSTCLDCQPVSQRDGAWYVVLFIKVCVRFSCSFWTAASHLTWPGLYSQIASSKHKHTHIHTVCSVPFSWLFVCFFPLLDEREDVQKKTFTKWVNSQLAKVRQLPASSPLSTKFAISSISLSTLPESLNGLCLLLMITLCDHFLTSLSSIIYNVCTVER